MYHFVVQQQSSPEHASRAQRREYQTDVIKLLMDHLSDADVLLNDQAALRVTKGGHQQHIATNVFYFAGRVVDKLWHGACTPARTWRSQLFASAIRDMKCVHMYM